MRRLSQTCAGHVVRADEVEIVIEDDDTRGRRA
jgi:hypothetical protein